MTEQALALVRQSWEAFLENDFEFLIANSSANVKLYPSPEEPGVQPCYEGWEGILEYLANWYGGWEDYAVEAERFVEIEDWVVVDAKETGTAKQSGARVVENFAHAFKVEGEKIVEWRMFRGMTEAHEALGPG
jgi:ketosteroid isomerase-like protein